MKTLKWLKWTKISFAVFVFCAFLSYLSAFLHIRTWNDLFLGIALVSVAGWMLNPFPVIFSIIGIGHYLCERRDEQMRNSIGERWMLFPAIMLGSVIVFLTGCFLMALLTVGV